MTPRLQVLEGEAGQRAAEPIGTRGVDEAHHRHLARRDRPRVHATPAGVAQHEGGHALDRGKLIGPGGGGTKLGENTPLTNSSSMFSASWPRGRAGRHGQAEHEARRRAQRGAAYALTRGFPSAPRMAAGRGLAPEVHDVRAPDPVEVGGELGHQLPVFPRVGLEPVVAGLVPLREERVGGVHDACRPTTDDTMLAMVPELDLSRSACPRADSSRRRPAGSRRRRS